MIDRKNLKFTGQFLRSVATSTIRSSCTYLRPDPVYGQGYRICSSTIVLLLIENVPKDKPVDVPRIGSLTYNSAVK